MRWTAWLGVLVCLCCGVLTVLGEEGDDDDDCLFSCCDEDCCGESSVFSPDKGGCVPNVTAPGWNGFYMYPHEEGCVERSCCESACCKEGIPFSLVTGRCDGSLLFAFQDAKVVIGVAITEFRTGGRCLPTTSIVQVIDAGTPVGKKGTFCGDNNENSGQVFTCESRVEPEKGRFELLELPTQIFHQHLVRPGLPVPVMHPDVASCFLFYNVRFSVDCGPAKLQATDGCFNDADGTVVCPIDRACNNGCFDFINRAVDVIPGEETKSCATTPLTPGII